MKLMRRFSAAGCIVAVTFAAMAVLSPVLGDDWPQWRGPQRDGVWRESGIVEKFDAPQLPIKWRAEIGAGYCGPTVADGRVYLTDCLYEPRCVRPTRGSSRR